MRVCEQDKGEATEGGASGGDGAADENACDCSVCLDTFDPGDEITCLPCNHEFHKECIERWLRQKNVCVFCNAPFR